MKQSNALVKGLVLLAFFLSIFSTIIAVDESIVSTDESTELNDEHTDLYNYLAEIDDESSEPDETATATTDDESTTDESFQDTSPKAPVPTTPVPTTPVPTTPVPTTPVPTTPVPTTPVPTAPVPTAPVPTAPVPTAPVTTAPVTTAPVTTAPVTTAPVPTAPVPTAPTVTAQPGAGPLKYGDIIQISSVKDGKQWANIFVSDPDEKKPYNLEYIEICDFNRSSSEIIVVYGDTITLRKNRFFHKSPNQYLYSFPVQEIGLKQAGEDQAFYQFEILDENGKASKEPVKRGALFKLRGKRHGEFLKTDDQKQVYAKNKGAYDLFTTNIPLTYGAFVQIWSAKNGNSWAIATDSDSDKKGTQTSFDIMSIRDLTGKIIVLSKHRSQEHLPSGALISDDMVRFGDIITLMWANNTNNYVYSFPEQEIGSKPLGEDASFYQFEILDENGKSSGEQVNIESFFKLRGKRHSEFLKTDDQKKVYVKNLGTYDLFTTKLATQTPTIQPDPVPLEYHDAVEFWSVKDGKPWAIVTDSDSDKKTPFELKNIEIQSFNQGAFYYKEKKVQQFPWAGGASKRKPSITTYEGKRKEIHYGDIITLKAEEGKHIGFSYDPPYLVHSFTTEQLGIKQVPGKMVGKQYEDNWATDAPFYQFEILDANGNASGKEVFRGEYFKLRGKRHGEFLKTDAQKKVYVKNLGTYDLFTTKPATTKQK